MNKSAYAIDAGNNYRLKEYCIQASRDDQIKVQPCIPSSGDSHHDRNFRISLHMGITAIKKIHPFYSY